MMSPLTLPKRLSVFSLGGGLGGNSSLKRMSTTKVSKSTDALSSLDSPSVSLDLPSTPFAFARTRGGIRSSFLNLFRPSFVGRRRPSSPAVQPATTGPGSCRPRGRRPSDCSTDLYRSAAATDDEDDDDEDSVAGSAGSAWSGKTRSIGDRLDAAAVPPTLPRRPPHLLKPPSTKLCSDRPLPLLPPLPSRQPSPLLHIFTVSLFMSCTDCYV